jgi:hypothetical protein
MGNQGYRSNYLAAFESANNQLEYIYSEYHELQRRREKLEGVVTALEPFLQSASEFNQEVHVPEPVRQESPVAWQEPPVRQAPEPVYSEMYSAPEPIAEPIMRAERFAVPIPSEAFAPAGQELDALQLRINRALGLAVA